MSGGKVYGLEEVKKHNDRKDCWVVVSGKVYELTPFMDEHPGGDEVLLAVTGQDATADFEDVGHSKSAKEMMSQYYIGDIDASTLPVKRVSYAAQQATPRPDTSSSFSVTVLQFAVPVLLLALAFTLQKFTNTNKE